MGTVTRWLVACRTTESDEGRDYSMGQFRRRLPKGSSQKQKEKTSSFGSARKEMLTGKRRRLPLMCL
jgi:hypothetical protein